MKIDLEKLLDDIAEDFLKERKATKKKDTLGKVSETTRLKYVNWKKSKLDLEEEIKMKKEQLERKLMRELSNLYEDTFIEMEFNKKRLWNEIRQELRIDPLVDDLNIDPKTGIVSKWIERNDEGL